MTALKWLEFQGDIDFAYLLLVKKLKDIVARKRGESLKNKTLYHLAVQNKFNSTCCTCMHSN